MGSERFSQTGVGKGRQEERVKAQLVKDEVNRLLTQANVHRLRGRYDLALETIKKALEMDATNADVHEMMGDILRARVQLQEAKAHYQKALELEPSRVSAGDKLAKVLLDLNEIERRKRERAEILENPKRKPKPKNVALAALASAIPGLGQMYNEEWVKGAVVFGATLLCFIGFWNPLSSILVESARTRTPLPEALTEGMRAWSTLKMIFVWVMGLASVGLWGYGILDATMTAYRLNKEMAKELGMD